MRAFGLNSSGAGLIILAALMSASFSSLAFAAEDPCQALGKVLAGRVQVIQEVQSFREKKPTADQACAAFTNLSKINVTAIAAIERDGAWCRAPEDLAATLKKQQSDIDTGKKNACKAAAEMKKAQKNGGGAPAPFGGGDGIVGGDMKLPQGAL